MKHYGIPYVSAGDRPPARSRLSKPDGRIQRRGLLGQGSILAVTSYATPHLSGVARQVAASNFSGRAVPPPLQVVPNALPVEARMSIRRKAAFRPGAAGGTPEAGLRCATCHRNLMDPLGCALENFRSCWQGVAKRPCS